MIVTGEPIATQAQLVAALQRRGIRATQASVSRDITALGLVKVGGTYTAPNGQVGAARLEKKMVGRILRVRTAGDNLVVLFTDPGDASGLALALDNARWPEVVGTVAGDDTIFIACDGKQAQNQILKTIRALAPEAFV